MTAADFSTDSRASAQAASPAIAVRDLVKVYGTGARAKTALQGVTLEFRAAASSAFLGRTGLASRH